MPTLRTSVLSRVAGRLLTGPAAFAIAAVAEILIYSLHSLIARVKQRW